MAGKSDGAKEYNRLSYMKPKPHKTAFFLAIYSS